MNIFQCDAINGGEHDGHECANGYKAYEPSHAYNENGAQCAYGSSYAEYGQHFVRIKVFHYVSAEETECESQ